MISGYEFDRLPEHDPLRDEVRHGGPVEEPPQDVFLSDDPALALVRADMHAWLQAHPCDCRGHCECDDEDDGV